MGNPPVTRARDRDGFTIWPERVAAEKYNRGNLAVVGGNAGLWINETIRNRR